MAEITSFQAQLHSSEAKIKVAPVYSNASSQVVEAGHHYDDPYSASDDEIPTIDYSLLFSDDLDQRFLALEYLRHACQEYGFFYVCE